MTSKKEKIRTRLQKNEAKMIMLKEQIEADKKALEEIEAAEIKLLINTIDARGISTKLILKAIEQGDIKLVEKLLEENEESEDTYENKVANEE